MAIIDNLREILTDDKLDPDERQFVESWLSAELAAELEAIKAIQNPREESKPMLSLHPPASANPDPALPAKRKIS